MLFIKDYDFIHTRNLWFSNFKKEVLSTTQYEDISRVANLEKSMEIDHIFLQSHRQVKILSNYYKRFFKILCCLYEGETKMCSSLFSLNHGFIPLDFPGKVFHEADYDIKGCCTLLSSLEFFPIGFLSSKVLKRHILD